MVGGYGIRDTGRLIVQMARQSNHKWGNTDFLVDGRGGRCKAHRSRLASLQSVGRTIDKRVGRPSQSRIGHFDARFFAVHLAGE